ncbi:bifunctional 2-polyprenyl-6-hydroxyphenol methylase/3-demethylubiquinol 3-O-methyltransferase UbiG [Rhodococcus sp. HNM0569]|uniref:bifunctional 2-polyprenyl-6-hydroxyphenol methylase/3-demethylubiquinol 3-O-methyltransferase UbiG n=1 Tax=Rhodococcus sp. HNM0569 TaxID=2716340 RepID=UPI00146DEFBD|nr:bifunctional 2-polyprenyl-6-hydroxyphenol methylase/3-demethylubiquinol 3-O-methyltransferase UbiG [Rhodococcus sp. HNM0569]NLU83753.1 3-demethylubiquinone-9 3-O-methyltransferase [Rhodococcus sp. HNM0569]
MVRNRRHGVAHVIDNDVYNRKGATWWDDDNPLSFLHGSLTPGRFEYFRDVLARRGVPTEHGAGAVPRALDVGCGGGFLAERFARLGVDVTGVDVSTVSIETARAHAAASGLPIEYRVGSAEQLPVDDASFDVVYCCDVLEHVDDLDAVLAEARRVLRPGGVYLFDTINRTFVSRVVTIKVMQEWRLTRMFDTPIHDWSMFVRPRELEAALARHGITLTQTVGLGPRSRNPMRLVDLVRAGRGRLTYGESSKRMDFGRVRPRALSYMGFGVRA